MNTLALDPGRTTGVAYSHRDGEYATDVVHTEEEVYLLITKQMWDFVIYEAFASQMYTSADGLHTIELVGGIRAVCWIRKIETRRHTPVTRKPFVPEAKRLLVATKKKFVDHEVDALAHLLYFDHIRKHWHDRRV